MSNSARHTPSGGHSIPPGLSVNAEGPHPSLRPCSNGPHSNRSASTIESACNSLPNTLSTDVHFLSNSSVQSLSSGDVHSLSAEKQDTGQTDAEQGPSTSFVQSLNRGAGQVPDSPHGQGGTTGVGQSVDMACGQPADTRKNAPDPTFILRSDMTSWTVNQNKVLSFFRGYGHCITNHRVIAEKLNIPYGTIRNILRRLVGAGLIRTEPYKETGIQGIEVWYCGPDLQQVADRTGSNQQPFWTGGGQAVKTAAEQASWSEAEQTAYKEDREKDRENKNIEKNQSILMLSKEQIDELWPHMGEAGLFARDIQKVKSAMDIQGIENNPEKIIAQSLRFIDWQLAQGPIIDQHGKEVMKPVAYWQASMTRNGCYQMPPGYIDPEVLALRQLVNEENAKLEARRTLEMIQAEKERQARRDELDAILRALADERESHPLWLQVEAEWAPSTRLEVSKNSQAIVNSPGIAATTRIALRKIYGWPE